VTNSSGSRHCDVLVIGAGVIGCSIALHLRRLGHAVHVLERAEIGAGTSSRGFGLVWAQTKSPNAYLELTMASVAYYPELLDSLGTNCDYQRPGGLVLLESEAQAADMQALMRQQTRTPAFTVEFLDQRQARELEPALAESLLGATYCPLDGHLDPKQLTAAFGEAALRAGARIHPRRRWSGLTGAQATGLSRRRRGNSAHRWSSIARACGRRRLRAWSDSIYPFGRSAARSW
jgi:glycine/D-amino acid oxidase-like deaminating enzyme